MGLKSQYQMRLKKAEKRRARRKKIQAKGQDLSEFFYGSYYLKSGPAK